MQAMFPSSGGKKEPTAMGPLGGAYLSIKTETLDISRF